ncbi:MAG TPA: hypothetical protein VMZ50_11160 [Phycisphaerae bacterium]|nr:hypothetical protein [Phycisphaerae bacterium]
MATKVGTIPFIRDDGREVSRLVIRCDCGLKVYCTGNINACKCARDYSLSGQVMAPRSAWGEETGETAADILRPIQDHEWGMD